MSTLQSQTQRDESEDEYERAMREIEEDEAREEQKRAEEEKRRKEESEQRVRERKMELMRRKAEAEKKRAEEEARRKAEEEEARQKAEEEARKRAAEVQRAQDDSINDRRNDEGSETLGTPKRKMVAEVVIPRATKRAKKSGEALTIRLPVPGPSTLPDESVEESSEEDVMETRSRRRRGNYDADGAKVKMGGTNRCTRCMANGKDCQPSEGRKIFSCARCAASKYRCLLGTEADLPEGERQMLLVNEMRKMTAALEAFVTEQRRANRSMVAKQKRIANSSAATAEGVEKMVRANDAGREQDKAEGMEE